jgi:hypothetical protein
MYCEFICDKHEMLHDLHDAALIHQQIQAVKSFTAPGNGTYINFSFMRQYSFLLGWVSITLFKFRGRIFCKQLYASENGGQAVV